MKKLQTENAVYVNRLVNKKIIKLKPKHYKGYYKKLEGSQKKSKGSVKSQSSVIFENIYLSLEIRLIWWLLLKVKKSNIPEYIQILLKISVSVVSRYWFIEFDQKLRKIQSETQAPRSLIRHTLKSMKIGELNALKSEPRKKYTPDFKDIDNRVRSRKDLRDLVSALNVKPAKKYFK